MDKCFIKTSDAETADKLRNAGYKELARDGRFFVFYNDPKIGMSFDNKKMVFSSMLNV